MSNDNSREDLSEQGIVFSETAIAGTGWKKFEDLGISCEKIIHGIVLGHKDESDKKEKQHE
jgi:hypothetical protein